MYDSIAFKTYESRVGEFISPNRIGETVVVKATFDPELACGAM